MVAKHSVVLFTAIALLTGVMVAGAPVASARTYQLDPAANIALPRRVWGSACTNHPMRRTCERIMTRALNHARAVMDEPPYKLPARFNALRARDQMLVLANLDRKLYRRPAIAGLNATLNATAKRGAEAGADPSFVPVGGRQLVRGAANWAGGLRSPLAAYFLWMYDDAGEGWAHRHTVLMSKGGRSNLLIMGVGWSPDGGGMPSWALILESFAPSGLIQTVPTLLGLSARSATAARGSAVRLFGFGFLHVRQVTFGGVPASFTRTSLFTISAMPPPHAPGRVHVRVVTAGGTSPMTRAATYTY
jgi:hypothetical protein